MPNDEVKNLLRRLFILISALVMVGYLIFIEWVWIADGATARQPPLKPRVTISVKPKPTKGKSRECPVAPRSDRHPGRPIGQRPTETVVYLPPLPRVYFPHDTTRLPPISHRMNARHQRPTPPPVIMAGDRKIMIDY